MSASITWSLPTLAGGPKASRNLVLTVTDADGVTAQRLKTMALSRVTDAGGGVIRSASRSPGPRSVRI